jgi:argininosuccinate lyase
VSASVIGRPIEFDDARLETVLSARHFIDVRTTPGGPAPAEITRALAESRQRLEADSTWLSEARSNLQRADAALTQAAKSL